MERREKGWKDGKRSGVEAPPIFLPVLQLVQIAAPNYVARGS